MNKAKVMGIFVSFMAVSLFWQVESFGASDESYSPGPVVVLHTWLGDQCSFVPDFDIGNCCAIHDMDYQVGGSEFQRWRVDLKFRNCIRDEGRPVVATIYYWGVRWFGWIFFNYN